MRNALTVIQADLLIAARKENPDANVTELLRCANARMVGFSVFHLDNYASLAKDAKKAFDNSDFGLAEFYVSQMIFHTESIKGRAERHEFLS